MSNPMDDLMRELMDEAMRHVAEEAAATMPREELEDTRFIIESLMPQIVHHVPQYVSLLRMTQDLHNTLAAVFVQGVITYRSMVGDVNATVAAEVDRRLAQEAASFLASWNLEDEDAEGSS